MSPSRAKEKKKLRAGMKSSKRKTWSKRGEVASSLPRNDPKRCDPKRHGMIEFFLVVDDKFLNLFPNDNLQEHLVIFLLTRKTPVLTSSKICFIEL